MPEFVRLTDHELAELTKLSTRDRVISASFGTPGHGVRVNLLAPENRWMIRPLAALRGVTTL
jgi:hypothetical protein